MVTDKYGAVAKLVPNQQTTAPAVWLMTKNGPESPYKAALSLDRNAAIALTVELKRFIRESSPF